MFKEENGFLYLQAECDYPMYCIGRVAHNEDMTAVFMNSSFRWYAHNNFDNDGFLLPLLIDKNTYNELFGKATSPMALVQAASNIVKAYHGKDEIDTYNHYKMYAEIFDRNHFAVVMLYARSTWNWIDANVKDFVCTVVIRKA